LIIIQIIKHLFTALIDTVVERQEEHLARTKSSSEDPYLDPLNKRELFVWLDIKKILLSVILFFLRLLL